MSWHNATRNALCLPVWMIAVATFGHALPVAAAPSPGSTIENAAAVRFLDSPVAPQETATSNTVVVVVQASATPDPGAVVGTVKVGSVAAGVDDVSSVAPNDQIRIKIEMPSDVPIDPTDAFTVVITTEKAGDWETMPAQPTAGAAGVYQTSDVWTTEVLPGGGVPRNGIVEVTQNGVLTVQVARNGTAIAERSVLVDPSGRLFDSQTGTPVSGAEITLFLVGSDDDESVAEVFADPAGTTSSPNPVITDTDGFYQFPFVAPGAYRLRVTRPPPGFLFPSRFSPNEMGTIAAAYPNLTSDAPDASSGTSYGDVFVITSTTGPVFVDIPLDPTYLDDPEFDASSTEKPGLTLSIDTEQRRVEVGDFVEYIVRVGNLTGNLVTDTTVKVLLPLGFAYVPDTARTDTIPLPDPLGGRGASLVFDLGQMEASDSRTLRFLALVRLAGTAGTKTASAIARALDTPPDASVPGSVRLSRVDTVAVAVDKGVFSDDGLIVGKVFADCNADGRQVPGEYGIPGVRLFLQNGRSVLTDENGLFTISNVQPGTNVLRLERSTLPQGARLTADGVHDVAGLGTRMMPMLKGEMHRVDFAIDVCSEKPDAGLEEPGAAPAPTGPAGSAAVELATATMTPAFD